jgi:hypothetical protein
MLGTTAEPDVAPALGITTRGLSDAAATPTMVATRRSECDMGRLLVVSTLAKGVDSTSVAGDRSRHGR